MKTALAVLWAIIYENGRDAILLSVFVVLPLSALFAAQLYVPAAISGVLRLLGMG